MAETTHYKDMWIELRILVDTLEKYHTQGWRVVGIAGEDKASGWIYVLLYRSDMNRAKAAWQKARRSGQ